MSAEIISFPRPPLRAWHVRAEPAERTGGNADFVGCRFGSSAGDDGPERTQTGPLHMVMDALILPEHRRGLPIIAPPGALALVMERSIELRPFRAQPLTDREKFTAAAVRQKERLARPQWERGLVAESFRAFETDDTTPGGHAA